MMTATSQLGRSVVGNAVGGDRVGGSGKLPLTMTSNSFGVY